MHRAAYSSIPFEITNGVEQGCILPPVLFNLFFSCVLTHALCDLERGVYLRYGLDGSLFDVRRPKAKTETLERLFADSEKSAVHSLMHQYGKFI